MKKRNLKWLVIIAVLLLFGKQIFAWVKVAIDKIKGTVGGGTTAPPDGQNQG